MIELFIGHGLSCFRAWFPAKLLCFQALVNDGVYFIQASSILYSQAISKP